MSSTKERGDSSAKERPQNDKGVETKALTSHAHLPQVRQPPAHDIMCWLTSTRGFINNPG